MTIMVKNNSSCKYSIDELKWALTISTLPISRETKLKFWEPKGSPPWVEVLQQLGLITLSSQLPPLHPDLKDMSAPGLLQQLRLSVKGMDIPRGMWNEKDMRKDYWQIKVDPMRKNAHATAFLCKNELLKPSAGGGWQLRIKPYGQRFHLCDSELFVDQPSAAGSFCTGMLITKDILLTAWHFVEGNIRDLRVVFNYNMLSPDCAKTNFSEKEIYRVAHVIGEHKKSRQCKATYKDWALLKLDREVVGQETVTLSREPAYKEQPISIMGFPKGLPLKYSPGKIALNPETGQPMAHVDVFMGNSGSGVFTADNKMIGMVTRTDPQDMEWTAEGRKSMKYPNNKNTSYGAFFIPVSAIYEELYSQGGHFEY